MIDYFAYAVGCLRLAADRAKRDNDAAERECPKCGSETAVMHFGPECSAGCETFVRHCMECDWQGEPE